MQQCPYFKKCGSCQYNLNDYQKSLDDKKVSMQKMFNLKQARVVPCVNPYHYRYKVIFSFYKNRDNKILAGLYQEDSHHIVAIEDCLIQNEPANAAIKDIVALANEFKLTVYNDKTGRGLLRHVLIRTAYASQKMLVTFVLNEDVFKGAHNFINALRERQKNIVSIVFNYNHRNTSVVLGDKEKVVFGSGFIKDELGPFTFEIASKSFYQVNPPMALKIYEDAIELAQLRDTDVVLDAYSGTGTIALFASLQAKSVDGVEANHDASKNANVNKTLNHIKNVHFINSNVENYMINRKFDVVFTDPPRSGMTEKFIYTLLKIKPRTIIYISCNPITLKRDLNAFKKDYKISNPVFYDQFAFTQHFECITCLTRK